MATAPKALASDDESRRAYFPAPHRDPSSEPAAIGHGPGDHGVHAETDPHGSSRSRDPRRRADDVVVDDAAGSDDESIAVEEESRRPE